MKKDVWSNIYDDDDDDILWEIDRQKLNKFYYCDDHVRIVILDFIMFYLL